MEEESDEVCRRFVCNRTEYAFLCSQMANAMQEGVFECIDGHTAIGNHFTSNDVCSYLVTTLGQLYLL